MFTIYVQRFSDGLKCNYRIVTFSYSDYDVCGLHSLLGVLVASIILTVVFTLWILENSIARLKVWTLLDEATYDNEVMIGFVWFILSPCRHYGGYIDSRSRIKVHTDERRHVYSARSSLTVTHPSNINRVRRCLTSAKRATELALVTTVRLKSWLADQLIMHTRINTFFLALSIYFRFKLSPLAHSIPVYWFASPAPFRNEIKRQHKRFEGGSDLVRQCSGRWPKKMKRETTSQTELTQQAMRTISRPRMPRSRDSTSDRYPPPKAPMDPKTSGIHDIQSSTWANKHIGLRHGTNYYTAKQYNGNIPCSFTPATDTAAGITDSLPVGLITPRLDIFVN